MAIEAVREYMKQWGVQDRILEFEVSSATVELAAQAVGCEPARIAKTLSFFMGDHPILIVAAGDRRVDNHKYKDVFHTKGQDADAGAGGRAGWPCGWRCVSVCGKAGSGDISG